MTTSHVPPSRQGLGAPKLSSLPSGKPPQRAGFPAGPRAWPNRGMSPLEAKGPLSPQSQLFPKAKSWSLRHPHTPPLGRGVRS